MTSPQPHPSPSHSPCIFLSLSCMSAPSSRPSSHPCHHPIWISRKTVTSHLPHQRRRRRMVPALARLPVPVLTPVQEQGRSPRCGQCLRHNCQLTFPIPHIPPRLSSARLHTNTPTTFTPSLLEKSQRGRSSLITSSGYTHVPVSLRPAPSSP